jgi:hypothetical protein
METKTRVRETENDDSTLKATMYLAVLSKRVAIGQTSDVTAGNEAQCHNDNVARENNTMEGRGMVFVWLRNRCNGSLTGMIVSHLFSQEVLSAS